MFFWNGEFTVLYETNRSNETLLVFTKLSIEISLTQVQETAQQTWTFLNEITIKHGLS